MGNSYFDGSTDRKIVFHFIDHDRTTLREAEVDSVTSVIAKDDKGNPITIPFQVTRNTQLGSKSQWIYGKVLDVPDRFYYQIEMKLHIDNPETDTIEVFLKAPPIIISV